MNREAGGARRETAQLNASLGFPPSRPDLPWRCFLFEPANAPSQQSPPPASRLAPARFASRVTLVASGALLVAALSGCGSAPKREIGVEYGQGAEAAAPAPGSRARGRYYLDDGPGSSPPADLDSIPEPVVRLEPLRAANMRPYVVMGQSFTPMTGLQPYRARGVATWYGRRYHGRPTASGEIYDMYGISAAHPTLPIPSYARVTNLANGKSVVVRINDRGPFIDNRLIDLSYTAAHRIGLIASGSALVEVEAIVPDGAQPVTTTAATDRAIGGAPPSAPIHPTQVQDESTGPGAPDVAYKPDPMEALLAAVPEARATALQSTLEITVAPVATPAHAAEGGVVYLQLGAFGSRGAAERYLARARAHTKWLSASMHVVALEGLYRVHAGPYDSVRRAQADAERIASALGTRPLLVTRSCVEAGARVRAAAGC
jgi:rare lipoprotein A